MTLVAREIHAWAKCNHENVLALIGLTEHRGRLAMVSPWMENGTLPEYVAKNPGADRLELVASGLAYLHGCEMVHGDLKGANVLVSRTGVAKIADFGNMKVKEQSFRFTTRTSTVYSLRWAAPELLDQSPVSPEADVYALGMTIYETMIGQAPYAGMTDAAVVVEVAINEGLPDWNDDFIGAKDKRSFRALLHKCWSRVHSARPRAVEVELEVSSVLRGIMEGRGLFSYGGPISLKEFCELNINGGIRQIHIYTDTARKLLPGEQAGNIILIEVEINDLVGGVHQPWIRLQISHSESISRSVGYMGDNAQAFPSQQALEVGGGHRIGQLISNNKPVNITHLQRLLYLCGQPRGRYLYGAWCQVIFECMKGLFDTTVMENDGFPLRADRFWPRLEEFKAHFLSNPPV